METRPVKTFDFITIDSRAEKIRSQGLTMVLDKGLGLTQAHDLMAAAEYIDIVKLGWATPRLFDEAFIREKIRLYKSNAILVGNGGTMIEIAHHQSKLMQFLACSRDIGLDLIEVSNGVVPIAQREKADMIKAARDMGFQVISEVGKKDPAEDRRLSIDERIREARSDLDAGARCVIIEAREGGKSLGVYDDAGSLKQDMAKQLIDELGCANVMFESPEKSQQAGLILLFGADVNLGNIRPDDVVALETLRRGIRGDTFGKI